MILNAILACDLNNGIGYQNDLPWPRHKEDMKWFRENTTGGIVIMGRKTWESIGSKPLKDRYNIVLTSNPTKTQGTEYVFVTNLERTIDLLKHTKSNVWIIGGKNIYEQFLPQCDKLYLTKFKQEYKCDKFISKELLKPFQKLDYSRNEEDYSFTIWSKIDGIQ